MREKRFVLLCALVAIAIALTISPLRNSQAANSQADDASTYYKEGLALLNAEKFEEAIKAFGLAIKLKPDYADAYARLGEAYSEIGEPKKALEACKQVVKYQPDSATAFTNLGDAYPEADFKKAIEAYSEAIRLDPKAVSAHFKLGEAQLNHGKQQLAVAEYQTLEKLDAGVAQDLYNLIYKPTVPVVTDGVVRLRVIALDAHGFPIKGLASSDFSVVENDAPQTISLTGNERTTEFYGLAIDTSGSMRPIFNTVLTTSKEIIERLRAEDQALMVRFISYDKIETVQDFTSNKRWLNNGLDSLYVEGGQSAVLDAVYLTAERLASYKFPNRNVHRIMLLLSDGEDRQSYYAMPQVLALLRSIDVQIFAVSLINDNDGKLNRNPPKRSVDLLRTLASETGGVVLFPKSPAELRTTVEALFDIIHHEYTIEYKPTTPPEANKYRAVSVSLASKPSDGNSMVISRSGYSVSAK